MTAVRELFGTTKSGQGVEYRLACNEKNLNHLHGGNIGFDKVIWRSTPFTASLQNNMGREHE